MDNEYISELISNISSAYHFVGIDKNSFDIKIVYRGEGLFYHQGGKALICEMSVAGEWVDSKSIKKWNDGKKITDKERELIKSNIELFFNDSQKMAIRLLE